MKQQIIAVMAAGTGLVRFELTRDVTVEVDRLQAESATRLDLLGAVTGNWRTMQKVLVLLDERCERGHGVWWKCDDETARVVLAEVKSGAGTIVAPVGDGEGSAAIDVELRNEVQFAHNALKAGRPWDRDRIGERMQALADDLGLEI